MRCLTWVGVFLLLNSSLKRKNSFCFSQEKLDIKVKTLEIFIRLSKINCEKLQDLTTKRLNQQNITMIYYTVKSKIGNRGNTAGKRKKHGRKPQKTPGETCTKQLQNHKAARCIAAKYIYHKH